MSPFVPMFTCVPVRARGIRSLEVGWDLSKKTLVLRRRNEVSILIRRGVMKLKALDAAAATAQSPVNWFSGTFFAALTIISASAATDAQTSADELNPAEQWVVAQVTAGEKADLSKKFPEEKDRKLSAQFVENLLT